MSDDTTTDEEQHDERMDRAERIRRKRESRSPSGGDADGGRQGTDDDADAGDDDHEEADEEDGGDLDVGDANDGGDAGADDPDDDDDGPAAESDDDSDRTGEGGGDDPLGADPTVTGEPTADAGTGGVTATAVEATAVEGSNDGGSAAGTAPARDAASGGVTATAAGVEADGAVGNARGREAATHRIASIVSGDTIADESFFAADSAERAQVLEFDLGEETFAIDVGYVDEIVETPEIARMPNTPDPVRGVVDLRGRVTAVVDPSAAIAAEADPDGEDLVIVLDSEELAYGGTAGWLVDDVNRVRTVAAADVSAPPADDEWVRGVIEGEDGLTLWTAPEAVLDAIDDSGIVDADSTED